MPVRSLNSSVLKWPSRKTVGLAVRSWTAEQVKERPEIIRLCYFGSYARGDWGVGSDLGLIAVVNKTLEPLDPQSGEKSIESYWFNDLQRIAFEIKTHARNRF